MNKPAHPGGPRWFRRKILRNQGRLLSARKRKKLEQENTATLLALAKLTLQPKMEGLIAKAQARAAETLRRLGKPGAAAAVAKRAPLLYGPDGEPIFEKEDGK